MIGQREGPASHGDACSDAAAASMVDAAPALRRLVWEHLTMRGPQTCDQIEAASGLSHQTCSARCTELLRMGCLARTGEKRRTRTGRHAWVLEATAIEPL